MSNAQRAARGPVVPAGDMGIGLCLQCLFEVIMNPEDAPPPMFGITFAPLPQNGGWGIGAPVCFEHLRQSVTGQPGGRVRKPLLMASGSLAR